MRTRPRKKRDASRHRRGMGTVTFNGLALATAPGRVMTPRAASEQLVAAACARLAGRPSRVADVGTGSGAIAVAASRLTEGGGMLLQLDRRVVAASRGELPMLRAALGNTVAAAAA